MANMKPKILIVHASGTNRDEEAARACELAGGAPEIVHINQLRASSRTVGEYDMLLIPGGFSYGDALGAGVRMALDMQIFFTDQLTEFVASGKPVLGICNGFQVLVKAGLLPGWLVEEPNGTRQVTLTENERGTFECRWVHLAADPKSKAAMLHDLDDLIFCPVAQGEGNFQVKDTATMQRLKDEGLIALRYVDTDGNAANGRYPLNPNGSAGDIAGICNARGNVIGLMPHPEDHLQPIQNPLGRSDQLGLSLFEKIISTA